MRRTSSIVDSEAALNRRVQNVLLMCSTTRRPRARGTVGAMRDGALHLTPVDAEAADERMSSRTSTPLTTDEGEDAAC